MERINKMFISDLTKIEIRKYKNSIPKYIEENYSYLRKEKDNFYTFTSKAYASEELLLNETVITFLKKCDGKHKIVDIEKEISQQFPEVSVKELNRDFMEVLRMMNMLGLIKWLKANYIKIKCF